MKLALISGVLDYNLRYKYRMGYRFMLAQKWIQGYWDEHGRPDQMLKNHHRWGYFIILDNGTPEGALQSNVDLLSAYDRVQPDELVIPDVLFDGSETLKTSRLFLAEAELPPRKRMLVPQGSTMKEWKECLDAMVSDILFATIGVAKHMEGKEGGRVECLRYIQEKQLHYRHHVHLLGCYENPVMEVRRALAIAPWIRGIDTAAPFAYAQADKDITCGEHISHTWDREFDEELASENIDRLLKACAGG